MKVKQTELSFLEPASTIDESSEAFPDATPRTISPAAYAITAL
jgi:hypothetical protein